MKIKTISYQQVKNLGNYESERLEMSAELDEGENPDIAAATLRRQVNALLINKPFEAPSSDYPENF